LLVEISNNAPLPVSPVKYFKQYACGQQAGGWRRRLGWLGTFYQVVLRTATVGLLGKGIETAPGRSHTQP
jgi:hypothetical protein